MQKIKWKLEYSVTLFVIFGVILLLLPVSVGNSWQAGMISKWNERYNRVDYMFSVIKAHFTDETKASFQNAKTDHDREKLMLLLVKPYLRVDTSKKVPRRYKPGYIDKTRTMKGQFYYFNEFYFMNDGGIVGIKDIEQKYPNDPIFIMMFDLNGILPPNRWGKDIFGVNIYKTGNIEPFGYDLSMDALEKDCSSEGTGITCSYYYKIGGAFEDK